MPEAAAKVFPAYRSTAILENAKGAAAAAPC
jgi:hypothetical protein